MSSGRLQQQFIRLWQCCDGKTQDTTLNELAELLSCSRRHMRTLLNTMKTRGWLTWEAEVGRGKRSRLTFLYTGLALQQQRAEDLLEQDRIDQLVQLVGDKTAVRQMLVSHLGRSFRQGRAYPARSLLSSACTIYFPVRALRRSETHIARQIFSALIRVNEENGELEADIAHHWQQFHPYHWRFFLRPGIHFHHGRELEMEDVIASLMRINALPLYSHINADRFSHGLDAGYSSRPTRPLASLAIGASPRHDAAARMGDTSATFPPPGWHWPLCGDA